MYRLAETESYRDRDHDNRTGYSTRGSRGGRSYRGRGGRGGRGAYRGSFRHRHDQDYSNYATDYMQVIFCVILYVAIPNHKQIMMKK